MRFNIITIILAILIAVFTMGNIVSAQPPTPVWTQTIGGEFSQHLNDLDLAYATNSYITVGSQVLSMNGDTSRIVFMQFDGNGIVQWQNNVQPGNISNGYRIRRNWDNTTYIIAGSSRLSFNNQSTLHLIKINAQGTIQWTGNYGDGQLGMDADVACAYTGEYILLGNVYSPNQFIRLFKVSQSGAEIWNKTIGGYYSRGKSIIEAYDPGFFIAGSIFSFPNMSNDFYLVKINSSGDTLWTKSWGDSASYEEYVDIAKTTDGKLIVVGNRWIAGQNQIVLTKFDLDGNIIWTRTIGAYENYLASSVIQDNDNGYLISGTIDIPNLTAPILIKTNANGYVRWITQMPAGNYNIGGFAKALPASYPGGYMAVGSQNNQTIFTNMLLAKIDNDPQAPVTTTPFVASDIELPFTGGQFNFNLNVTNESAYVQTFDIWTIIDLPNIGQVPVIVSQNRTLAELGSISRTLTQSIPATAPAGIYTYNIYLGNYPYQIYYYDSFTFMKTGSCGDGGLDKNGWDCAGWFDDNQTIAVMAVPTTMSLFNSPNPFNPVTTINYTLPQASNVTLSVFDITGRQIATLVNEHQSTGGHEAIFDGSKLTSGIYLAKLSANGQQTVQKLMLVK